MDGTNHRFKDLFAQLGLPTDNAGIEAFLREHSPVAADIDLPNAPFWSTALAAFLREEWREDADWAQMVDQLDLALRAPVTSP